MARWPDATFALIFLLLPALCWLAWWFVRG
jgi:hypothetical protein